MRPSPARKGVLPQLNARSSGVRSRAAALDRDRQNQPSVRHSADVAKRA
ncbi:MAG: hypothetical protein SVX43_16760 [Cyanobacteriota bacterium]|nr:hypothetical protein [Cyanobacteriota bacterium]